MKVFVAHFNAECNEHISHIVNRDDFHFLYGDDCVKAMKVEDIFRMILKLFLPYMQILLQME